MGHLKQACGCKLDLHGQSWEQVADSRGPQVTFIYCPVHAAAPRMLKTLARIADEVTGMCEWLDSLETRPSAITRRLRKEVVDAARALLRELELRPRPPRRDRSPRSARGGPRRPARGERSVSHGI